MKYAIFSFSVFLVIVNEIRLKNNNCIVYDQIKDFFVYFGFHVCNLLNWFVQKCLSFFTEILSLPKSLQRVFKRYSLLNIFFKILVLNICGYTSQKKMFAGEISYQKPSIITRLNTFNWYSSRGGIFSSYQYTCCKLSWGFFFFERLQNVFICYQCRF